MSVAPMPAAVAKAVVGRSGDNCEAMVMGVGCTMQGEHLHHRLLRSQGGRHHVVNVIHICHRCHEWIHHHPREAAEAGYIVRRSQDPARVRLFRRGRWVLLDQQGRYEVQDQAQTAPLLKQIDWGETKLWQ